jgi:hypothetical protein
MPGSQVYKSPYAASSKPHYTRCPKKKGQHEHERNADRQQFEPRPVAVVTIHEMVLDAPYHRW